VRVQSPNQYPDNQITQLPDSRAASAIGRAARLELSFERRRGRTILAHSYAEPPFRIGHTFDLDGAAHVIVVSTGAGIFAGDTLQQSVRVGPGARVVLTSQSALQVHPAARPSCLRDEPSCLPAVLPPCLVASVHHRYIVEDDGELQCQWDAVIPFASARLDQRFDLRVAESGRLYWSDALMAGRVSRGEAWRFESLAHELSLRVGGALAYLERYRLAPGDRAVSHPWMAGRAHYLGTLLAYHEGATEETAEALHRAANAAIGGNAVAAAVDLIRPRTIAGRFLTADGAPFSAARASCHALALASIFGAPGRLARK
jgi:urease accessory protein